MTGQSAIAELLVHRRALRPDLTAGEAADVLFTLSDAHLYETYARDRAWTPAQVAQWLGNAFCCLLLP